MVHSIYSCEPFFNHSIEQATCLGWLNSQYPTEFKPDKKTAEMVISAVNWKMKLVSTKVAVKP